MKNERNVFGGEEKNERTNELSGEYTIKCQEKKNWYAVVVVVVIAAYDFDGCWAVGWSVGWSVGLPVDCLRGLTKAWIAS